MTLLEVVNKYNSSEVDNVILDYSGDVEAYESLEEFEEEITNAGIDDEEVSSYKFRNNVLTIKM